MKAYRTAIDGWDYRTERACLHAAISLQGLHQYGYTGVTKPIVHVHIQYKLQCVGSPAYAQGWATLIAMPYCAGLYPKVLFFA